MQSHILEENCIVVEICFFFFFYIFLRNTFLSVFDDYFISVSASLCFDVISRQLNFFSFFKILLF